MSVKAPSVLRLLHQHKQNTSISATISNVLSSMDPARAKKTKRSPRASAVSPATSPFKQMPRLPAISSTIFKDLQNHSKLTACQLAVLSRVALDRESVFYTGGAGTGKSFLLSEIIHQLKTSKSLTSPECVAVTAPTGIAAVNVQGCTLHSFVGAGLFESKSVDAIVRHISVKNKKALQRWRSVEVLVIDEVSMVSGDTFDKLEAVARRLRGSHLPFGGIQLVVTGDFFQLPPIQQDKQAKFAFEAASWAACFQRNTFTLKEIFRQKDEQLIRVLNEIRLGQASKETISFIESLSRPIAGAVIEPTKLFATRNQVHAANLERLENIRGQEHVYNAYDHGIEPYYVGKLSQCCLAPEELVLKPGAQVMLLKNLKGVKGALNERPVEKNWRTDNIAFANGSIGVVVKCLADEVVVDFFDSASLRPGFKMHRVRVKREEWSILDADGSRLATRTQIPLMLSYALSIHKSQGQSLPCVSVDLDRVFEMGQAYVALSRATCLEGLQVLNFDASKVRADKRAVHFYTSLL